MKAKMLKIAGVKSEAAFYKKFPTQEAFMKVHGKEFKKAQMGTAVNAGSSGFNPISYSDQFDKADKTITGSTAAERQLALEKQQAAAAVQKGSGGGFDIGGLMKMVGSFGGEGGAEGMDLSSLGGAKYGKNISKAQFGNMFSGGFNPGNTSVPSNVGYTPMSTDLTSSGFQMPNAAQNFAQNNPLPQGVQPTIPTENGWTKTAGMIGKYAGPVGDIIGGIGELKKEKELAKQAKQTKLVSDVSLNAAKSIDIDARRQTQDTFSKQRRSLMQPMTGENLFPVNGVGTNVLAKNGRMLKGGGEIQNTYDPNDIYDDLGYEPLNDSNVKQYYHGGSINQMQDGGGMPWGEISHKATGMGQELMGGQNAGGKIGGTLGNVAGNAIGGPIGGAIGEFVGGIAGNALDPYGRRIKKDNAATQRNMQGMANVNMAKGIHSQNQSYMEDGGWVSNDWQPQVIASFGGLDEQEVYDYAHEGMDTLRAGGHLRDYTPPSNKAMEIYEDGGEIQSYGLGGELQTHWGGGAETISRNPYLPGTGETVMFRGKSHEEYSPNGETGIGVTYGGNPVEVERGEPMVELEDGGEIDPQTGEPRKSGVVFGNLKIPNQYIDMLGDTKAKGKKFKNYVADLSKTEDKQNTLIEKSTSELSSFVPKNSFDKLKLSALQANLQGANMKLKDIADKKINAATLQNAINDTAEEQGLIADDLAKGKIKTAKFGGKFSTAAYGTTTTSETTLPPTELNEVIIPARKKKKFERPGQYDHAVEMPEHIDNPYVKDDIRPLSAKTLAYMPKTISESSDTEKEGINPYIDAFNQLLPYVRPTDQESLDASQLYGEMNALASNQLEPVQANFYHPELSTPYDISRQAAKNDLIAQTRAAQRQVGYNPAAQAMIAAQSYGEMQKLNEADFLANQAMKDKVYAENRAALNDAKLKNLAIADQQYTRQSEAKSNTKATTQAALNSIAEKFAKNKLENRQLGVMENMYNYRFDSKGRAINMNPLAQFNIGGQDGVGAVKESAPEGYEYETILKKKKKDSARNGSIVKSIKNL